VVKEVTTPKELIEIKAVENELMEVERKKLEELRRVAEQAKLKK
jgi:hypothetical protein